MTLRVEGILEAKLITLLRALILKKDFKTSQTCAVATPTDEGLKFSSELSKTIQAHLYLPRGCFREWSWKGYVSKDSQDTQEEEDDFQQRDQFGLPLELLLQVLDVCGAKDGFLQKKAEAKDNLSIFGMEWDRNLDSISIKCKDENSQISCSLSTITFSEITAASFSDQFTNPVLLKLISQGDHWKSSLQHFSTRPTITFEADPSISTFNLFSEDHSKSIQVTIPTDSEFIDSFTCHKSVCETYPTIFLQPVLRVLHLASKLSLRINSIGTLSLQMIIPLTLESAYLEFVVAPLITD